MVDSRWDGLHTNTYTHVYKHRNLIYIQYTPGLLMSPLLYFWSVSARACELRGLSDTVPSPDSRERLESWAAGRDWGDLVGEGPATGEKGKEMRGSYGEGEVLTGDGDCKGRIERDLGAGVVWENMSGL